VLVAGDIRENVFPSLVDVVNQLKAKAAIKQGADSVGVTPFEKSKDEGTSVHDQRIGS
jgi:hypothetical protein